jgi:excisionase family DNA binding protein
LKRFRDSQYFTVEEAAKKMSISTRTVLRRIQDGSLEAYLMPGSGTRRQLRIEESEIDAAITPLSRYGR